MKITIRRNSLNEIQTKRDVYECPYQMKIRQDANFEQIKTDIRAIKGVSIVGIVTGSKKDFETFEVITYKIKFVPYASPIDEFIHNLEASFRKLSRYGLMSAKRISTPKKLEA